MQLLLVLNLVLHVFITILFFLEANQEMNQEKRSSSHPPNDLCVCINVYFVCQLVAQGHFASVAWTVFPTTRNETL